VLQELMRYVSTRVTLDTYTQAITEQKRKAQSAVVKLLVQPHSSPDRIRVAHLCPRKTGDSRISSGDLPVPLASLSGKSRRV
jgi:hypothetical protein